MSSLKKIAAISAIICGITLILTIILTPFAVSSTIDFYNELVARAEANTDNYIIQTDLDSKIKEITLENSGYYGYIVIEKSPDQGIHILTQDRGFNFTRPEILKKGTGATVNFHWFNDPKLTEENILQLISAEMLDNYRRETVIQLPADASLHLSEEYLEDLYYNIDIQYDGFANYAELEQKLDNWYTSHEVRNRYNDYISSVENELQHIEQQRYHIAENIAYYPSTEDFQLNFATHYTDIKNTRSDVLKRCYNFRKEYGKQPKEELDAVYLEYSNLIEELCAAEKQYDLLSAKCVEAEHKMTHGEITEEEFSNITDTCFIQQIDLDLLIGTLRDKFSSYLREEIITYVDNPVYYDENGNPMTLPSETAPVAETETVEQYDEAAGVTTPIYMGA